MAKNEEVVNTGGMSMEQLLEAMKVFATELRKPDEETQRKRDEEKSRIANELKSRFDAEIARANGTWAVMNACTHRKDNGYHTWAGQVLSGNGDAIAICSRCQKDFRWQATNEQLTSGLQLEEMKGLSEDRLAQWEKAKPPKIRAKRLFWKELAELQLK
jgi:hypothetical protein